MSHNKKKINLPKRVVLSLRQRYKQFLKLIQQYKHSLIIREHAKIVLSQINKEGGFFRKPGNIYLQDIQFFASSVSNLAGAFAEIGVRHGNTFRLLLPIAQAQGKAIYALDSFLGTKQNSIYDGRPDFDMSIGGVDVFWNKMSNEGFTKSEYNTLAGWIPEVFEQFPDDISFSFVILDVDNYTPTLDSLNFIWPRLQSGGILFCDDFCTYHQIDAGRAIREFLRDNNDYWLERILPNYQIILRKN